MSWRIVDVVPEDVVDEAFALDAAIPDLDWTILPPGVHARRITLPAVASLQSRRGSLAILGSFLYLV